jgi:DNA-binding response OmpR family regulator
MYNQYSTIIEQTIIPVFMQKVIVVDDNEDILEAVSLVLKRKSMDVVALKDPVQIEQNIPLHQPVLLLMDIFLGRYDGRGICRHLKNSPLFDQLSIILFSAQTYTPESVQESGADAFLNKPFSLKDLSGVIDRLLNKVG